MPKGDLYNRILSNIDKYSFLADMDYAGPITRKKLLDPIYKRIGIAPPYKR